MEATDKFQNMQTIIEKWEQSVDKKYLANIKKVENAISSSSNKEGGKSLYVCIELPRGTTMAIGCL